MPLLWLTTVTYTAAACRAVSQHKVGSGRQFSEGKVACKAAHCTNGDVLPWGLVPLLGSERSCPQSSKLIDTMSAVAAHMERWQCQALLP